MSSGMLNTVSSFVSGSLTKSSFTGSQSLDTMSGAQAVVFVMVYLLALLIVMALGAFLFNNIVVKIFSSARKVSVLEFFGLYVVLQILAN